MINQSSQTTRNRVLIVLAACGIALGVAGCEKKKKAPPPPPPAPAPQVEIPKPVDIAAVLQELKADARIKFADETAPADRTLAEGVIKLAHAMAKGDSGAMKGMLDKPAQLILDKLVSTGEWAEETKPIEQVRIVSLSGTTDAEATNALVGMAIQAPGGAYLLAWNGTRQGNTWVFGASPSQADSRPRASDFDGVAISTSVLAREDAAVTRTGGTTPGAKPDAAPAPADSPTNPRRKSTPAGPITIPGG